MPDLPGHERRKERRESRHRRIVSAYEEFTSQEQEEGDVTLQEVQPGPEAPEEEQMEPWAWGDKPMPRRMAERLGEYRQFLQDRREAVDSGDS